MRGRFVLFSLVLFACTGIGFPAAAGLGARTDYPLDAVSRAIVPGEELPCERGDVPLVTYRGELIRYERPLRVHEAFRSHLVAFEGLVDEVARAHFGRAPRRIAHFGAYACRPMRRHARWMSEHALGNALDVAGFDFGPLRGPSELPRALRRAFRVRVLSDWDATGNAAPRAAFLRDLADRIIARPELFRSIVGPGFPGHDNHLHLAQPPYRMVKVGDVERWFW